MGGGSAGRELGELLLHEGTDVKLRVRMGLVLGVLAAGDEPRGLVEGLLERGAAREGVLEEGFTEPSELAIFVAAKGAVIGICGGDDHRAVALQIVDENTGIAGRDDDDTPADPRGIECLAQIRGCYLRERQRTVLD